MLRCWVFCGLWLISFCVYAAPTLQLRINNSMIQLGQPIVAHLIATDVEASLSQIDLTPLRTDFGIAVKESRRESNSVSKRQTLILELFPRKTGQITLPSLSFHEVSTRARSVTVQQATLRDGIIALNWSVSKTSVWERQQIIVTTKLHSPEKFATVDIGEIQVPGIESHALPVVKKRIGADDGTVTEFTMTWLLYPQTSALHKIDLPVIRYSSQGLVKRQFYLPLMDVRIKPLPPYIPPIMAVGNVSILTDLQSPALVTTNHPIAWQVTLQSRDLLPQMFPPVLRQIKSDNRIKIDTLDSQRHVYPDNGGVSTSVIHKLSVGSLGNGFINVPSLRLQYFDPDTAKLKTIVTPAVTIFALDPIWISLLATFVVVLVGALGWSGARRVKKYLTMRRRVRHALVTIEQAADPKALRMALNQYAGAVGWPDNTTLEQFFRCWRSANKDCESQMRIALQELSSCYYGRWQKGDFGLLRSNIRHYLRR